MRCINWNPKSLTQALSSRMAQVIRAVPGQCWPRWPALTRHWSDAAFFPESVLSIRRSDPINSWRAHQTPDLAPPSNTVHWARAGPMLGSWSGYKYSQVFERALNKPWTPPPPTHPRTDSTAKFWALRGNILDAIPGTELYLECVTTAISLNAGSGSAQYCIRWSNI